MSVGVYRFYAKLGKDGRVVIPRDIIRRLNLEPGDKLRLEIKEVVKMGTIEVREIA